MRKVVDGDAWDLAWSARAGIEISGIRTEGHPGRVLSLLAQYYDGVGPYGRFNREDIRFYGVGLHFSL